MYEARLESESSLKRTVSPARDMYIYFLVSRFKQIFSSFWKSEFLRLIIQVPSLLLFYFERVHYGIYLINCALPAGW